jgi:hypothetical protein
MCENRMLRRILGAKSGVVTVWWRKLHEEFHNLYAFPDISSMIKFGKWLVHAACVRRLRSKKNLTGRDQLENLSISRRIKLKLILKN